MKTCVSVKQRVNKRKMAHKFCMLEGRKTETVVPSILKELEENYISARCHFMMMSHHFPKVFLLLQ